MISGGGKRKGSSFERLICTKLSMWITDGKQEDVFWRSATSGGRSTVAHAKGKRMAAQAGDISCIHPAGHIFISKFMVEVKAYANLDYVGLLSNRGHLVDFWNEAKMQAKRYGKLPLLIAKQNRQPTVACLTLAGIEALQLPKYSIIIVPKMNLRVVLFEDFLKCAIPP
jgi:hypothetical protein